MPFKSSLALVLLFWAFSFPVFAQQERLIFAVDVIRHGDRTPIHDLPSLPYAWPQGFGQLTPTGMQQEYQLGVQLRKRYIEEGALLPEHYEASTLFVRSSDFDRTLMSAESLLIGLYPLGSGPRLPQSAQSALPSGYQPIPTHTIALQQDLLLVADSNPQQFQKWVKKYIYPRPDWKQKTAELRPQFARWSSLSGIKITALDQLISLADTLYVRRRYQLALPSGMTETEAKAIMAAGQWAFVTLFKAPAMGQVLGQPLLTELSTHLKQAAQHENKLRVLLYSSHDSTILGLMSAMHMPMETQPPYASDLNFALFETETGEKIIRVSLNGESLILPACGKPFCTLAQWETLISSEKKIATGAKLRR